jgi:hypothetical protein
MKIIAKIRSWFQEGRDGKAKTVRSQTMEKESWSWSLRHRGEWLGNSEGYPTKEAAMEGAEERIRSSGGSANWKSEHSHIEVTLCGPKGQCITIEGLKRHFHKS